MTFNYDLKTQYNWDEFIEYTDRLVAEGRTSGDVQSEAYIHFTKLNQARMRRVLKKTQLKDSLKHVLDEISQPMTWYVITEAWCGDSGQLLPGINMIANASPHIDLIIVFRDENPALMDDFLTNGNRSVPKLIAVDKNNDVLFTWGARPEAAKQYFNEMRSNPQGRTMADIKAELQKWYNRDMTNALQDDLHKLLLPVASQLAE